MSIYTKSGDRGETGLLGGKRISKSSLRIEAIGNVDELNATLGVLCTPSEFKNQNLKIKMKDKNVKRILTQIQHDLFAMGAELANQRHKITASVIGEKHAKFLEEHIDALEKKLPALRQFILPTGTPFAAHAHLARAICRRAERTVVALNEKEPVSRHIVIYLNRLSDLLFMLAREDLYDNKIPETPWESH